MSSARLLDQLHTPEPGGLAMVEDVAVGRVRDVGGVATAAGHAPCPHRRTHEGLHVRLWVQDVLVEPEACAYGRKRKKYTFNSGDF